MKAASAYSRGSQADRSLLQASILVAHLRIVIRNQTLHDVGKIVEVN
ncbi:hypothetical protein V1224_14010 [Lachnospiraceae bacterium JLR.KK008]